MSLSFPFRGTFLPLFDFRKTRKEASPDSLVHHRKPLLLFHWQGSHALQMSCNIRGVMAGSHVKDLLSPEEWRQLEAYGGSMHSPQQKRSCRVHSQ